MYGLAPSRKFAFAHEPAAGTFVSFVCFAVRKVRPPFQSGEKNVEPDLHIYILIEGLKIFIKQVQSKK